VARNRKRRSAGRERRPGPAARPGVATARGNGSGDAPDPIEHATPDVELAEAQLALGRPQYVDAEMAAAEPGGEASPDDEPIDEAAQAGPGDEVPAGAGGGGDYDEDDDDLGPEDSGSGGRRRGQSTAVSARRERPGSRLVHFLQGSWRELQRVQWPDRRQVMQATGVVIGFVIVAGAFLGVADFAATKIVKLILP
jgi:preprotein translocase subunit SecE